MKKVFSLVGIAGLALLMSLGLPVNQTSASSTPASISELTNEVSPYAVSRFVVESKVYPRNVTPPSQYYYSDSNGYKGYIPLDYIIHDSVNYTSIAVYAGTVYCEGNCPISASDSE